MGGTDKAWSVHALHDEKIIATGEIDESPIIKTGIVRYFTDGSIDPSFGVGGKLILEEFGYSKVSRMDARGRLLIASGAGKVLRIK